MDRRGIDIENPTGGEIFFAGKVDPQDRSSKFSQNILWFGISLAVIFLLARVFYLQVFLAEHYSDLAENNRIRTTVIKAPRGAIRDRAGQVLVQNIPSFDLTFVPALLPRNQQEKEEIFARLAPMIELGETERTVYFGQYDQLDIRPYLLKEDIPSEKALELVEKSAPWPGIFVSKSAKRKYVDGEIFSHLIGYEGKITQEELARQPDYLMIDNLGKMGLELVYEKQLHGRHGQNRFEVDSEGKLKQELGLVNPVAGDELVLNIDADLQRKSHEMARLALSQNPEASGAAVVALDPKTGAVRALVSLPSFDNNLFSGGISAADYDRLVTDEKKPLLNRAISGEYPSGSTFKTMVAVAALSEGIIQENTVVDCSGAIALGQWNFPDWKVHGPTDVKKAIAESCDVFFYTVGGGYGPIRGLGLNRINQYARSFGYGEKTGIDLSGERQGLTPDENWKFAALGERWYIGDSYHYSIGQGFLTATPLQVAVATAAIANGGTVYQPRVVEKIIRAENGGADILAPRILSEVADHAAVAVVREGMRQTVASEHGSARNLSTLSVSSAGKTGTAQFGPEKKLHSWYASFAPFEDPELALVVLVDGGGEGHDWAVPITKEIYRWYFDLKKGSLPDEEKKPIQFGKVPTPGQAVISGD